MRLQPNYTYDDLSKMEAEEMRYILERHFDCSAGGMDRDEMFGLLEEELLSRDMLK